MWCSCARSRSKRVVESEREESERAPPRYGSAERAETVSIALDREAPRACTMRSFSPLHGLDSRLASSCQKLTPSTKRLPTATAASGEGTARQRPRPTSARSGTTVRARHRLYFHEQATAKATEARLQPLALLSFPAREATRTHPPPRPRTPPPRPRPRPRARTCPSPPRRPRSRRGASAAARGGRRTLHSQRQCRGAARPRGGRRAACGRALRARWRAARCRPGPWRGCGRGREGRREGGRAKRVRARASREAEDEGGGARTAWSRAASPTQSARP